MVTSKAPEQAQPLQQSQKPQQAQSTTITKTPSESIELGVNQEAVKGKKHKAPAKKKPQTLTPLNKTIDICGYPYPKLSKGNVTGAVSHVANLRYMLECYGILVRYNLITKKQEITFPSERRSVLRDNASTEKLERIKSLCEINAFPVSRVQDQLSAIANGEPYNPVIDYCTSSEWDGVDRVKQVTDTVTTHEKITEWKNSAIHKFLKAAICAAINDEHKKFKFKSILTFQGKQTIGKTPFMRILTGELSALFLQGHILNPENKDSKISALTNWIVELGEVDATTKKADVAALKGFIDQYEDTLRLPYASENSTWIRRTVLYATVNPTAFLVDNTGNDRWWCVPVQALDLCTLEKINMQQLWAQIYQEVINDLSKNIREPWALTKEETAQQAGINELFRLLTPVEEAIQEHFKGREGEDAIWQASTLDICEAIGWAKQKISPKERAAAQVMLEGLFKTTKYKGKRGFAIPHIRGTCEAQLRAIGMIRRGKQND